MALRRLGPNGLKQNAVALVNPLGKYKPIAYNSQAIGYLKLREPLIKSLATTKDLIRGSLAI